MSKKENIAETFVENRFEKLLKAAEDSVRKAQTQANLAFANGTTLSTRTVLLIAELQTKLEHIRNLYIFKKVLEKVPQKTLAEQFGLSRGRISQIVKHVRETVYEFH